MFDRPQGCEIECPECRVLRPGLDPCPVCGGTGSVFQPARMADPSVIAEIAAGTRARIETAKGSGELEGVLRAALIELLVYGIPYAAAFEGREVPAGDLVAEALEKAVRARLRFEILAAGSGAP